MAELTGPKRLVIVGATGMVGGYALGYALNQPVVGDVTAIGRRALAISHPKLKEVLHSDFADCSALAEALSRQEAVVFCLGTYTGSVSDAVLCTITVDYPIEFARVLRSNSPDAAFSFLSGSDADPSGRSRLAFARYKGEAENALHAAGFPRLYIFRPAYIYPVEPRKEPNVSYRFLRAIYPAFRLLAIIQIRRLIYFLLDRLRLSVDFNRKRPTTPIPRAVRTGVSRPAMNDEDAIRQIGPEAADALNRGDVKGYAAFFTADADYLDSFGRLSQGRDQIEQTFTALMAGPYQGAKLSTRSDAIRLIGPTLAVVDFTSEAQMPAGLRKLRGVSVAVKHDGKWRMTAVRTWLPPSA